MPLPPNEPSTPNSPASAPKETRWHSGAKEAAKARQIERQRLTTADLADATHVHDGYTWRRVVRVNAKTVTVTTAYSWTDRLPIEQIRDHRTITEEPPCPTS